MFHINAFPEKFPKFPETFMLQSLFMTKFQLKLLLKGLRHKTFQENFAASFNQNCYTYKLTIQKTLNVL